MVCDHDEHSLKKDLCIMPSIMMYRAQKLACDPNEPKIFEIFSIMSLKWYTLPTQGLFTTCMI